MSTPAARAGNGTDQPEGAPVRLCIIGGSPSHPGGLEAYCERALDAFRQHAPAIDVSLFPTEAAYVDDRGLARMMRCAKALVARRGEFDFAWVQVSSLAEALFVPLARALGWTVLVTPHFGGTSRLETRGWVRRLRLAIMARAHGVGLLFAGQDKEISLPSHLPRHVVGTFLPAQAFATPPAPAADKPLALIYAARFSAAKGSLLMLDLCGRLKNAGIPFSARLVGRGDPSVMEAISRKITENRMADQVSVIDWLDADGIAKALREADVLVHLSAIDSFPLIVLEALAADTLPIVRPMAGSLSMVRSFGGHSTEDEQPDADAYGWLAGKDLYQLRREARDAGKRARVAYGWPKMVHGVLDALDMIRPPARG